jgi:hypothetical protein
MSEPDRELAGWQREWQTMGGDDELKREVLLRRVRRDGARMRLAAAGEILAAAASSAFCIWLVVKSGGAILTVALAAGVLFFNGAWLMRFFTTRQDLFGGRAVADLGGGLDAFVELTRRRFAAELGWTRFVRRCTIVLAVASFPWCLAMAVNGWAFYRAEPWRAVVGFGGVAVIFAGLFSWSRRKERRLREESARFDASLTTGQG